MLASLVSLSDRELVDSLDRVAERDRATNAEIIAHLVLIEDRRIHLDWGYPSLFVYCTERLRFSEDCAYKRIQTARAAARSPEILEYLEGGELTLSTIKLLAPHVDKPEGPELVEIARGMSKREVERLVAARFPEASRPRGPSLRVRAIDGENFKLEMTVDGDFLALLERAVDLDRHRNPEGDRVRILREGLELQVAAAEKRKFKATDKPRPPKPGETRSVPAEVRRRVHLRDEGRCIFIGKDGRRCDATSFIEHDHVKTRAQGGKHTVENGRELCSRHNGRSAELALGKERIERAKVREARRRDAQAALRTSGFSAVEARDATAHAESRLPENAPLEELLRQALARLGSRIDTGKGRPARAVYPTEPPPGSGGCSEPGHFWVGRALPASSLNP